MGRAARSVAAGISTLARCTPTPRAKLTTRRLFADKFSQKCLSDQNLPRGGRFFSLGRVTSRNWIPLACRHLQGVLTETSGFCVAVALQTTKLTDRSLPTSLFAVFPFTAQLCSAEFTRGKAKKSLDVFLKRFLSILSAWIFDSSVDRGIPSFAAAPDGPKTRPCDSRRASSIVSF